MRAIRTAAVLTFLIVLVGGSVAMAQMGQGRRPGGGGQMPSWDPSTVQTIKGTIAGERGWEARGETIYLVGVNTEQGTKELVLLGPKSLLDPALTSLPNDSSVEVTGSKVKGEKREFILASRVRAGDREYRLRNEQGQFLDKTGQPLQGRAAR